MTTEKISILEIFLVLLAVILMSCWCPASAKAVERGPANDKVDIRPGGVSLEAGTPVEDSTFPSGGISMRVLWTVSHYVFGKDALWGDKEAKALLFKPLDITDTGITFNGQTCKGVHFQREMVKTAEYLAKDMQGTMQTLGIHEDKIQVIKTSCDIPGFQEYMQLRAGGLIVPMHNVFIFFEPAVTK